ncbi:hypothetical protein X798_05930 [Onchocerca flexuosa]|uniref:Uncharacterized protein n=1 Tax=Onchocerca flexuosa TaxID=387005 RepID=A0A238BQY7_9BILA|nr:hypothetical protein X798_05930 [Onchocerca flexuosa]
MFLESSTTELKKEHIDKSTPVDASAEAMFDIFGNNSSLRTDFGKRMDRTTEHSNDSLHFGLTLRKDLATADLWRFSKTDLNIIRH